MQPNPFRRYLSVIVPVGTLTVAMMVGTGCNKQPTPAPQVTQAQPAPAPPTDSQITAQVQSQIASEDALKSLPIQVEAANGVVTLSGKVNDDAARELAANDAAQVAGVKTVVNNLIVAPERAAAPPPVRRLEPKKKKAAPVVADDNPPPPPPAVETPISQVAAAPPPPPPPPPKPVAEAITIPAGTDLPVRISEALETGKTQTNDAFHGVLTSDLIIDGVVAIPQGSAITGRVVDSKDAAHFKGNASLSLELTQVAAKSKQLTLVTDPLVREGAARGKNTAEKAGGGALLGTLIGALAGGGKGALIGAAAGAGAGAGVNAITKGQQVKIPSETILRFKLKDPAQVTVMVMPGQGIKSYSSGEGGSSDPTLHPRN